MAFKTNLPAGKNPVIPKGWAAFQLGPALDTVPATRSVRRRGPNRAGTVAPMTVDLYQQAWVVYDPARHTIHWLGDTIPNGSVPIDSVYGVFASDRFGVVARFVRRFTRPAMPVAALS
jgi:hypothetical protein